jgi:hypothetical protein
MGRGSLGEVLPAFVRAMFVDVHSANLDQPRNHENTKP